MFTLTETRTALVRSILAIAAVVMLSTPAAAASFQLVKIFDTPLIGSADFEFTIEKKERGVWIEIPCIDFVGSCNYTFSDLPAGTSVVLADSGEQSWFSGGDFYIREFAPIGWALSLVTSTGTSLLSPTLPTGEVYFSFNSPVLDPGDVTLHTVGPFAAAAVPEPGTLGLLALGLAALGKARRRATRSTD